MRNSGYFLKVWKISRSKIQNKITSPKLILAVFIFIRFEEFIMWHLFVYNWSQSPPSQGPPSADGWESLSYTLHRVFDRCFELQRLQNFKFDRPTVFTTRENVGCNFVSGEKGAGELKAVSCLPDSSAIFGSPIVLVDRTSTSIMKINIAHNRR